jgi:hypothetical protein
VQLHLEDESRPMTAAALHADLSKEEGFHDVTISQVQYHAARLRDAGLLPTE